MLLTTLALVLAQTAAPAPANAAAAPKSAGGPITVAVEAPATASDPVRLWTQELKAAIAARKDELRLAHPGEKAELVVRVDSVSTANGGNVLNAALVKGSQVKGFNLSYPGEIGPQAEKLARNLRAFSDAMKAASPAPTPNK